jgi:hypothetical protein
VGCLDGLEKGQNVITLPDVSDIPVDAGHWLAGLTDGEGFFRLGTRRKRLERYPGRIYHGIEFVYGIALRADDGPTLLKVQQILKVGHIGRFHDNGMMRDPHTGEFRPANPRLSFRVQKRLEIGRVVATFGHFPLRSKKARDFELWQKAWRLYHDSLVITPRKVFRKGLIDRPSLKKRQPLQGEIKRFYTIPKETWELMDQIADELKAGRRYVEPATRF